MKLFKQITGQKLAAPEEVVVQPNAQFQAEEAQKCRELQGCTLADFEQRVTLGARPPPPHLCGPVRLLKGPRRGVNPPRELTSQVRRHRIVRARAASEAQEDGVSDTRARRPRTLAVT
jgi:hypothetical protein